MKHILLLALLCTSFTASAIIVKAGTGVELFCNGKQAGTIDPMCYMMSTTTSLPTLIIEGQEMDLNSDEASMRLVAEAHGDAGPVLSHRIASDLNISVEDVLTQTATLSSQGDISVAQIVSSLQK